MEKKKTKSAGKPKAKSVTAIVPVAQPKEVTPRSLMALALTQNASAETIGKFMDLQDRYEAKMAKRAFDVAMADFQSDCPPIKKTKAGGSTNAGVVAYRYAPLDAIVAQTKALIQKHGFSYAIKTQSNKDSIKAICIVKHKLGHSEESDFEVPSTGGTSIMSGPQKVAAALTFAKRYAFCNAFGIMTSDEDIDAAIGVGKSSTTFDLAMKMIAGESSPTKLKEHRKKILDGRTHTPVEAKKLIEAIDEKLKDENGA